MASVVCVAWLKGKPHRGSRRVPLLAVIAVQRVPCGEHPPKAQQTPSGRRRRAVSSAERFWGSRSRKNTQGAVTVQPCWGSCAMPAASRAAPCHAAGAAAPAATVKAVREKSSVLNGMTTEL